MKVVDFIQQQNFYFPVIGCRVLDSTSEALEGPDAGMMCDITNIVRDESMDYNDEKYYKVYLNFKPYEEYNKVISIPSFWDKDGNPTLKWHETKYYKGIEELILEQNDDIEFFLDFNTGTWREQVSKIQQCSQRQDSTVDQLKDLMLVANRLGFYDAADFIKNSLKD